jgi:hypothetical protein
MEEHMEALAQKYPCHWRRGMRAAERFYARRHFNARDRRDDDRSDLTQMIQERQTGGFTPEAEPIKAFQAAFRIRLQGLNTVYFGRQPVSS